MSLEFGVFAGWVLASSIPACYALDAMLKHLYNKRIEFAERSLPSIEVPKMMAPQKIIVKPKKFIEPTKLFLRFHRI